MTALLSQAFEKASVLPENVQEQLAKMLFEYIEQEAKWDETLQNTQEQLGKLADKALEDYKAGRTSALDIDEL